MCQHTKAVTAAQAPSILARQDLPIRVEDRLAVISTEKGLEEYRKKRVIERVQVRACGYTPVADAFKVLVHHPSMLEWLRLSRGVCPTYSIHFAVLIPVPYFLVRAYVSLYSNHICGQLGRRRIKISLFPHSSALLIYCALL